MLTWIQSVILCTIPVLVVALYTSSHFFRIRKKRGYLVFRWGTLFILVAVAFEILSWGGLFKGLDHNIHRALLLPGWFITIMGLVQLFKVLPKRARNTLYTISLAWFLCGLLIPMASGIITSAVALFSAVFIRKWIGYSKGNFVILLASLSIAEVAWFLNSFDYAYDLISTIINIIHVLFINTSVCMLLVILVSRISDVLDQSYRDSVLDMLTGLYNRRHFNVLLKRYVEREMGVSVIFVDLDNFKKLNDTQGHEAGDIALKSVASILKEEVDGKGFAGRYGGEEMVLLVTNEDLNIDEFAERVRYRVEHESMPRVTASIGFARWDNGITSAELVDRADKAMYHSKTTGKNKVTGYRN